MVSIFSWNSQQESILGNVEIVFYNAFQLQNALLNKISTFPKILNILCYILRANFSLENQKVVTSGLEDFDANAGG